MPSNSDWSWKLRLFFSADLVGSTAFKASQAQNRTPEWASTFRDFFRDFPSKIETYYPHLPKGCPPCQDTVKPWKFLGDEILFWVQLRNYKEAASHIWVFKRAVCEFPKLWEEKKFPLRLKATAWLAGFPVTNTELQIKSGESNTLDFIGPAIDLGFRISKFSDSRRFVIAADLALMLLDAIHDAEIEEEPFRIILHSKEILKGILSSDAYPVLWLDMKDGKNDPEEELLGIKPVHDPVKLVKFLRSFIDDKKPSLMRPFIEHDPHPKYGKIPDELAELRERMRIEEDSRGYLTEGEKEPPPDGPAKEIAEPKPPRGRRRKAKGE